MRKSFFTAIYNCFFRHIINEHGFHTAHAQKILVEISLKFDSKRILLYIIMQVPSSRLGDVPE